MVTTGVALDSLTNRGIFSGLIMLFSFAIAFVLGRDVVRRVGERMAA